VAGANLAEELVSVWKQALIDGRSEVDLGGRPHRVGRSRTRGLRLVGFTHGDHVLEGIEQNPETRSRWAQLAREGRTIMQFRCAGRYIANVCDGTLTRYSAWASIGLPD
jgi:hypothetical protein